MESRRMQSLYVNFNISVRSHSLSLPKSIVLLCVKGGGYGKERVTQGDIEISNKSVDNYSLRCFAYRCIPLPKAR